MQRERERLLDTSSEKEKDYLVQLNSQTCQEPIALSCDNRIYKEEFRFLVTPGMVEYKQDCDVVASCDVMPIDHVLSVGEVSLEWPTAISW